MRKLLKKSNSPLLKSIVPLLLNFRALLFFGKKYTCPCCGWELRAFMMGGGSFKTRPFGYCPRCNSKARHRRQWLFLKEKTNLFKANLRLLHVSPQYSLSRNLVEMPNIQYVSIDIQDRANLTHRMDLTNLAFESESFDAAICIHVLEHIEEDLKAINELYRVLKPGGWAVISVPLRLDQKTYEDPTVTSPEDREREFGESGHFRYYGYDLKDRLESRGFSVELDLAANINPEVKEKYGLLDDENVFYCIK